MQTTHEIIYSSSSSLPSILSSSVDLVVTSPPYPMIEMWDELFFNLNPDIESSLTSYPSSAFELMHLELDKTWTEIDRLLKPGSIVCINIGDATRKINCNFALYSNSSRIIRKFLELGYFCLPSILWRKQTNSPTKFMGSGMLPPGAYVTLEHEHILLFRKGSKREFNSPESKLNRRRSAYFWEERNLWFSDIWEFKGVSQKLNSEVLRSRSAAYPFELAFRLINMFSVQGDTVLDPFLGTGTTTLAAITSCRNSIGVEIDKNFKSIILESIRKVKDFANGYIDNRLQTHLAFVQQKEETHSFKHRNSVYGFPVMTAQETDLYFPKIENVKIKDESLFEIIYKNKEKIYS
ncbi:MAG: site-specific DNA-methyltransferase [Candidatus Heimdallarchaeum endolithica]|uniref:Type II methyltransferase n=1 Tax=Candidatus Heimdallarchaeum endolithica TaxID=2876572 RepID=A0A9Y1FNA2_9ARCH|nr:MAG: site-specific DNA-methyltransferase [Candidatus Heimdallarchaeum endolithica]